MSAGRICVRTVDLADRTESTRVAARRMHDRNVGTLVVIDGDSKPVGLVTDRDLAMYVVAEGRDPSQTTVEDVMTTRLQTIHEDTPIEQALSVMRQGPYRRLPVVDDAGKLAGLLSLDDILDLLAEEFGEIRGLLQRENPSSLAEL